MKASIFEPLWSQREGRGHTCKEEGPCGEVEAAALCGRLPAAEDVLAPHEEAEKGSGTGDRSCDE